MRTKTQKQARMPASLAMSIAADLIGGKTESGIRFLQGNPDAAKRNGTWENVVHKLIFQAGALRNGSIAPLPAFAVFATDGNSKLPFAAFSSMAVIDCPGRGDCERWCYSKTAWRHPNAWGRQVSNSMLLRTDVGKRVIAGEFARLQTKTLRLYVDGDFHSVENLEWWMDLIRTRPEVSVYGYSKSWVEFLTLHLRGFRWPENYILNLSGGSKHSGPYILDAMQSLPITRGQFIAVSVPARHMKSKAYQSKRNAGHSEYAKDVRAAAKRRVFVCPGRCGDCLPDGSHACGSSRMRKVDIAIGVH